jgi:hypothetical protein
MREVFFEKPVGPGAVIRIRFSVDRGQVIQFTVQLECMVAERWTVLVRYDTAHGFAHCDTMHPHERSRKERMHTQDYKEALSYAIMDLSNEWPRYLRRYETWIAQRS